VTLETGEVICDKCDGKQVVPFQPLERKRKRRAFIFKPKPRWETVNIPCPKCRGEGKLDWVENIVGKRPAPHSMDGTSASYLVMDSTSVQLPLKMNMNTPIMLKSSIPIKGVNHHYVSIHTSRKKKH